MPSVKGFGIKSFFYSASKLWNSLSPNLQHVTNKYLFKRNVKAYLWEKLLAVDRIVSYKDKRQVMPVVVPSYTIT